ncbi:hypothetical protein DP49_5971 [Burkholderia pseudomallei]|nr:hypothetical protein DP49_5971 [Burkholderia pseudomallei]
MLRRFVLFLDGFSEPIGSNTRRCSVDPRLAIAMRRACVHAHRLDNERPSHSLPRGRRPHASGREGIPRRSAGATVADACGMSINAGNVGVRCAFCRLVDPF